MAANRCISSRSVWSDQQGCSCGHYFRCCRVGYIPGAQIRAKDVQGTERRTVESGPNGQYRIDAITPSTYIVVVSAPGFKPKEVDGVSVPGTIVTSQNITLEVGSAQTTVSVASSGAQIQTENGELSQTISTAEVAKLPINSLNPIDLVLTQPGVAAVANRDAFTNGSGFSVNGLRPRANNFLIDGFDNNDQEIAGQALQPQNLEAIKEVTVLRNSYAPEFGRGGASVTNVIYRNGTNDFHGSLWERYTGSAFNALTSEEKRSGLTSTPRDVDNTFGFAVGGPAIKNRLFIFGSSQWHRIFGSEAGNTLILPTAQGVADLQAIAGANPNANILLNSLGELSAASPTSNINVGNRAGCGSPCFIPVGSVVRTPTQQNPAYEYIVRGDYTATERDTILARFIGAQQSLTPDLFANANALPTQDSQQGGPARNLGIYWTHVFRPTVVNEARFTAQQINFTFAPITATTANGLYALPNLTIAGFTGPTFGSPDPSIPQGRGHDNYGYQEALSWSFGGHSVRVGADINHLAIADLIPFDARGTASFVSGGSCSSIGLGTCTGLANFLDNFTGPSGDAGKQFGTPSISFGQTTQAYYIQDAWKVRPAFTLTYGVRYEYFARPFNALSYPAVQLGTVLTDPINKRVLQAGDKNNWAPRLGFAWNPGGGNTVIRGGAGIFYDGFFTNIEDNVASTAPNTLGGLLTAPNSGRGLAGAIGLATSVTPTLNPRAAVSVIDSRTVSPMTYQWNVNIQRELPWSFLTTIAYLGTRGERLFLNQEINPGVNGVRVNPARGSIGARTNTGDSVYHALQAKLVCRFQHGFLLEVAYTYSKAIDNGSEIFVNSGGSSYAQDTFNLRAERGVSAFDRPHRGAVTWVYFLPSRSGDAGWHSVAYQLIRNWTVSGTAQLQSGAPDTIYFGGLDENGDLRSTNDRPDVANSRAPINYSNDCLNSTTCITGVGLLLANGNYVDYNTRTPGTRDQFRYIAVNGRPGNLGRNTFRNVWTRDYSLAVERIFPSLISSTISWKSGQKRSIRSIIQTRDWYPQTCSIRCF